jgi:hypothetical protein
MVFPVVGGDGKPTGYEIENSLRFNDDDNPSLSRANDSGGSNTAGTLSFWAKRCEINTSYLFYARSDDSNVFNVYFSNTATSRLEIRSTQGGSTDFQYKTNMKFRDVSAWYHIVIAIDTTDGTAADRCKLFVNGSRITSFETQTNFDQNDTIEWFQSDATVYVSGEFEGGTIANSNDGYIADLNFVDGTQYDASYFGETNDNGVWIPKKFTGTQGTNGFRLEFQQTGTSANASGMGADTSGNGNHLTPSNLAATDVTVDTPTNNFATMIPASNLTISEGNLNFTHNRTSNWDGTTASMGVQNGKWYYEAKFTSTDASPRHFIGYAGEPETWAVVVDGKGGSADPTDGMTNAYWFHSDTNSEGYLNKTGVYGDSVSQWGIASGDIVGIAFDMDNQKIYFHKNGTYYGEDGNSSNPANGTNPAYSSITTGLHYRPFLALRNDGSETNTISMNFGNPVYSISSGNADANGYGNFEYAVPSGYYSLCTKNLAKYG